MATNEMKMHFKRPPEQLIASEHHLIFATCGKFEHRDTKRWEKQLTTDKSKVTCKNCMRRLGIPYKAFSGNWDA